MWGPIKTSTIFLLHSSQMVMSFTLIPTLSLSFFLSLPPTQISSGKKNKKKMKKTMAASVTRELEYFLMLAHEELWKLAQYYTKFAKVGSTFCQIRNKLSKICQRLISFFSKVAKFCQIWSRWIGIERLKTEIDKWGATDWDLIWSVTYKRNFEIDFSNEGSRNHRTQHFVFSEIKMSRENTNHKIQK